MEPLTEQKPEQKPAQRRSRGNHVLAAFLLGIIAGAAAMFCAGFLYLRHNLIVSYEFPGLSADDFDDALENALPAESGWKSSREACSLPLPSDGRALYNWKLCNREYARGIMDDPNHGLVLPALIPCTLSVTNDPNGNAVLSRLNTALLGVIYGGNARRVLRSGIAPEQEALISMLADGIRKEKAQRKDNTP